jgi:ferredoxin-NADP reductase
MKLELTDKQHIIDNVWTFSFKTTEPVTWVAGQFMRVDLPHPNPDDEGTKRWFTVSSAPFEKVVRITTRITYSTFKQALAKLSPGDGLQMVDAPDGDFIWQDSPQPKVFIAGGIGVTPFYSMLNERRHNRQPLAVTLIYNSRTPEVPFKKEFDAWAATDTQFTVKYVAGEQLTAESLTKLAPELNESLVYLSGPEPMVETLGDQLKAHGLPEQQLKQDFFPNYTVNNF